MKLFVFLLVCLLSLPLFALATDAEKPNQPQRFDNTWQGTSDGNWLNPNNWDQHHVPSFSERAVIPPTANYPFVAAPASCGQLLEQANAVLYIANGADLTVSGNADIFGTLFSDTASTINTGDLTIRDGSQVLFNTSQTNIAGNFTIENPTALLGNGTINLTGHNKVFASQTPLMIASLVITSGASISYSSTAPGLELKGNLTVASGGSFTNLNPDGIRLWGTLEAWNWSRNTVVIFSGETDSYAHMHGNSLGEVLIMKNNSGTTHNLILDSDLTISGSITMLSGGVVSNSYTLNLGGDFVDYSGGLSFVAGTGNIVFNGSTVQNIVGWELFNKLTLNKTGTGSNACLVTSFPLSCEVYKWQAGTLWVDAGYISINDLENGNLCGNFHASDNGVINISHPSASPINFSGQMKADTDGSISVLDDTDIVHITAPGSLVIASSGILYFGLGLNMESGSLYQNNGGILTAEGELTINTVNITGNGGTIIVMGADNSSLQILPALNDSLRIENSSDMIVNLTHDLNIGCLDVTGGVLKSNGHNLHVHSNTSVYGDGGQTAELKLNGGSLFMEAGDSLNINRDGRLDVYGTGEQERAVITCANPDSGRYNLNVGYAGIISANYARFEYMGVNGINITYSALVDPLYCFSNCVFDKVASGGTLLTCNTQMDLTIPNAIFPAQNAAGTIYNVTKNVNEGSVTFIGFSGSFSGSAFENDSYGRINWGLTAPPAVTDLTISDIPESSPAMLQLNWTYPLQGVAFNIYSSDSQSGPFTLEYSHVNTNSQNIDASSSHKFYYIKAVAP